MDFIAMPVARSCKSKLQGLKPFNGADDFKSVENVRLRAIPGAGYSRHSDTALTINILLEKDAVFDSMCGLLDGSQSCEAVVEPTQYLEVFNKNSAVPSADARCVEDWDRYVVMVNATLLDPFKPGYVRPVIGFWMQGLNGERVPIKQSNTSDSPNDWLEQALPAVRSNQVFRSPYWGFTYFSVPTLLEAVGEKADANKIQSHALNMDLHFTNQAPWSIWGREGVDMVVQLSRQNFQPFRETRDTHTGGVATAWHREGLKISVQVTASLYTFSLSKFGVSVVSWLSYLLFAVAIVKLFLFCEVKPLRCLKSCVCFCLHCGERHRASAITSWYRSLVFQQHEQIDADQFTSESFQVDSGQQLGLRINDRFIITAVNESGVVAQWNKQRLQSGNYRGVRTIATGDILVQVNGFSQRTPKRAFKELHREGLIEMTILHVRSRRDLDESSSESASGDEHDVFSLGLGHDVLSDGGSSSTSVSLLNVAH